MRFFSTAVLIQRETGGNLSEILDTLADRRARAVQDPPPGARPYRARPVHRLRADGAAAFLAVALSFINPDHMKLLFEDRMGQMMIIASIVMQAVGFFWIRQVIKIEV